jgi:hypothetical protein
LAVNDVDLRPAEQPTEIPSEDEYVWDVFIHRTLSLEDWNNVALLGSVYVWCAFLLAVDSIGLRTGLPEDDDYPSDESEVEDEADEDSNGEILVPLYSYQTDTRQTKIGMQMIIQIILSQRRTKVSWTDN